MADNFDPILDSPEVNELLKAPESKEEVVNSGKNQTHDDILDSPEVNQLLSKEIKEQKYGSGMEQLKAGAEGFAQGVAGPLAPLAEKALGVKDEDILGREEANPGTHYASELAGLIGPSIVTGGASAVGRVGLGAVAKTAVKLGIGETLAAKIGANAAKGVIESAMIAGSDETSKLILNDPNASSESAIAHIGLAGVLGGAFGASAPLWDATVGRKAGQIISDFKGRIKAHLGESTEELPKSHLDLPITEQSENPFLDDILRAKAEGPLVKKAIKEEEVLPEELKRTTGTKLADAYIKKILTEQGAGHIGGITGAGVGELLGGHVGAGVGYVIGKNSLGPFFNSVLPALTKKLVNGVDSVNGFRAATEYGVAVAKTEQLMNRASDNLLKVGSAILPEYMYPSDKEIEKLNKTLMSVQEDPTKLIHEDNSIHLGHYLPEHNMTLDSSSANAVTYLSGLRPDRTPHSPLDSKPIPSTIAKAEYTNALRIAQSPLILFDKIKNGTLTHQDIQHVTSMYPQLATRMQQKLMNSIMHAGEKDKMIPYKTRMAMSMFMGQPLDSTMQPMSIQATQLGQQSGQDQTQSQQQKPSKGTKSSPALQKMSGLYKTPSQNRQQNRQIKD